MMDTLILIAIASYGLLNTLQFDKVGRKLDELDELIRELKGE